MSSQEDERLFIAEDQLPTGRAETEDMAEVLVEATPEPEFVTTESKPRFQKKTVAVPKSEPTINLGGQKIAATELGADQELKILRQRQHEMQEAIDQLVAGRDGIKLRVSSVERKAIDWSKLHEEDVFDLNLPIEVVDHDMPDYMRVIPKDDNYVLRWVQKMPRRLGPMKAKGFNFCTQEDIEGDLNIAMEIDENGRIRFDDVLLMKIEKRLYFGMLRKNHERSMKMVNPKLVHQEAAARVMSDIQNNVRTDGVPGEDVAGAVSGHYINQGKLKAYIPGEL